MNMHEIYHKLKAMKGVTAYRIPLESIGGVGRGLPFKKDDLWSISAMYQDAYGYASLVAWLAGSLTTYRSIYMACDSDQLVCAYIPANKYKQEVHGQGLYEMYGFGDQDGLESIYHRTSSRMISGLQEDEPVYSVV